MTFDITSPIIILPETNNNPQPIISNSTIVQVSNSTIDPAVIIDPPISSNITVVLEPSPSPTPKPIIRKIKRSKQTIALITVIVTFAVIVIILAILLIWKFKKDKKNKNPVKQVHLSDLVT